MLMPESGEQLADALRIADDLGIKRYIIGKGSNVLVRDKGIRGLVIKISDKMAEHAVKGAMICAQAGMSLIKLCHIAQKAGLSGLEFACGIPGSVGGGVAMNAGAYGGELSDVLEGALVYENGEISFWSALELECGYRTTAALRHGRVILEARFNLRRDAPETIARRMAEYDARRVAKQPTTQKCAGSTFKRPEGRFAGALIDDCGLRGARVGGASVSVKHAGFIVNDGGATAGDVLSLIKLVKAKVFERHGIMLELEVRVLGEE
jgi:UDP-N-acetylmuramate dehydrogenase